MKQVVIGGIHYNNYVKWDTAYVVVLQEHKSFLSEVNMCTCYCSYVQGRHVR